MKTHLHSSHSRLVLRRAVHLLLLTLSLAAGLASAHAATGTPPDKMTYQGFLADAAGVPLGNATPVNYVTVFRIWPADSGGAAGTALWSEVQTVTLDKGSFSVVLGDGLQFGAEAHGALSAVFASPTASDRYLEITVTIAGSPVTIAPRLRLVAAPYSLLARNATSLLNPDGTTLVSAPSTGTLTINGIVNATKLSGNGTNLTGVALLAGNNTFTGTVTANAFVGDGSGLTGLPAAGAQLAGGNIFTGDQRVDGEISARRPDLTQGYVAMNLGTASAAGYFEWHKPGPTRIAYMGWDDGGPNNLNLNLENGAAFNVIGGAVSMYGNVGIGLGAGTPLAPLHVNGHIHSRTTDSSKGFVFMFPGDQNQAGGISFHKPNDVEVGYIGGSSGGNGNLGFYANNGANFQFNNGNVNIGYGGGIGGNFTLNVNGAIYCAVVAQFSDKRIKDVVPSAGTGKDLELIDRLKVTDYRMKHSRLNDNRLFKGFLGQEVRAVIPEAVYKTRDFVADINATAEKLEFKQSDGLLRVSLGKAHGLEKGQMVRLTLDNASSDVEREVTRVVDEKTFEVGSIKEEPKRAFVYGKLVEDFTGVDYNQIFTTGIGAIQELSKRSATQAEALRQSEARVAELEQKVATLATLERKLADLEKLVARFGEPRKEVRPAAEAPAASAKTGTNP